MANLLVLGVNPESAYPLARHAIEAGHHACVALSREQAFRKLLSGLVDTLVVDSPLGAPAQAAIFRQLRRSVPSLPPFLPSETALPVVPRRATTVLPVRRPDLTEALMRAVAYCFGLMEGRRLGVPTDVDLRADGPIRLSGLTTALQGREAVIEYLDPDAEERLFDCTLFGPSFPATAHLHFPGGGVLRMEGTVATGVSRRGLVTLRLTAAPDSSTAPAPVVAPEPATAA